jgi:putative transposase
MPRQPRIDIPGVLYHVLIRGIERRDLVLDDVDRSFFLDCFSRLLRETGTDCLAWALMTNHGHFLLRPTRQRLATLMRRLLTAHALHFNRRHRRAGHLFQNRYHSLPCEEENYLLALVRYIHLNPLRAGMVSSLEELDSYPWTGHSVIMGQRSLPTQDCATVMALFGNQAHTARLRYREFVAEGMGRDNGAERTAAAGEESLIPDPCTDQSAKGASPVLGSEKFLVRLQQEDERLRTCFVTRPALKTIISEVAASSGLTPADLCGTGRSAKLASAREAVCKKAVTELGYSGAEVGRALRLDRSSVCRLTRLKR